MLTVVAVLKSGFYQHYDDNVDEEREKKSNYKRRPINDGGKEPHFNRLCIIKARNRDGTHQGEKSKANNIISIVFAILFAFLSF
jgi:hypothetical protein